MPTKTPKQVWDAAPEGQAFLTWWWFDDDEQADGIVWIKGEVGTLDWAELEWLAPIEIGKKTFTKENN